MLNHSQYNEYGKDIVSDLKRMRTIIETGIVHSIIDDE